VSAPRATLVVVALVAAFGGVAWWLFSAEVPIHAPEFHTIDGGADHARGDAGRRAASELGAEAVAGSRTR
jgi:hypothetical protein